MGWDDGRGRVNSKGTGIAAVAEDLLLEQFGGVGGDA